MSRAFGKPFKLVLAYAKHAEVTVPSLNDWEKEWEENSQCHAQPKVLLVNFQSPLNAVAQSN